tara:strand:+ start:2596 stop:3531 length:936 start_codon:yes stop_codon:yes gene_type:complete
MIYIKKFFYISIFIIIFLDPNESFSAIKNKIIVKVDNQIVTNYELKNKILSFLILGNKEINQKSINLLKKQMLENLIQLKLKKIELSKYNIETDYVKTQNYIQSIYSNDIETIKKKFRENDLSYELFEEEIETEFRWRKLIYLIYSNRIQIDEKKINDNLKKILKDKLAIEEFNLSEIEIIIDDFNNQNKKISDIEEMLKKENFESIARKFSVSSSAKDDGNLGWINAKSLSDDIYREIKKLKKGGVTKPIKKQNSVLFLKLVDFKLSKVSDLDKSKLKLRLVNQKKNELFDLYSISHLSKLKNNSLIEYK